MLYPSASGITGANGSQSQMSNTTPTIDADNGTVVSGPSSGQTLNAYLTANPGDVPTFNVAPATYGALDYINLTAGGLSPDTRASGNLGEGALVVQDNGFLSSTPAAGDVFNLFDWVTAMGGGFTLPGNLTAGGSYGGLDLPTLSGTLQWDVSALQSHGVIAVWDAVSEPSRAMLLLFGLLGAFLRRRRRRA